MRVAFSTFSTEALHELISLCKKQSISVYIHTPVPASLKGVSESLDFDGMPLVDSLKHTCLPFYPVQGGDDTERVRIIQVIQSMGE